MKRFALILFLLILKSVIYGQGCALLSVSTDTIYYYIENLQTTEIEYFNLDTTNVRTVNVIKNENQKNIYGNPKGGKVIIYLKPNYFRGLKIGKLLKTEFYKSENVQFYVNNYLSTKKDFMNYKVKKLCKIEFIKQGLEVCRMNLTTNRND